MTARQALKSLCDLGVTYSQRGKGTFVSEIKLEKSFRQVLSFSEEMQATRPLSRTDPADTPITTFSIGIDTPENTRQKSHLLSLLRRAPFT